MKKIISTAVLMVLLSGGYVFAQDMFAPPDRRPSEYHYFTVFIERIYAHRLGYVVVYRRGPRGLAHAFIPESWFTEAGGRGELVFMRGGPQWPTMTVFTREGEFSHVRLRVRRDRNHETWRVVPFGANIDEYFQGIEELRLEF